MKSLLSLQEVVDLIKSGRRLLLAGDDKLLSALPQGQWVGGTIPYFMAEEGGVETTAKIQVGFLPSFVEDCFAKSYGSKELSSIPQDYADNGVSFIMIPAFSDVHSEFAKNCASYPGLFDSPLLGWVTGFQLGDSPEKPKVYNGFTGESFTDKALVLHISLADNKFGKVNIINLFSQGSDDSLVFSNTGFEVTNCFVNGVEKNFYDYVTEKGIDTQLPLVANYTGAMINVSIMNMDKEKKSVSLYAPVFPGVAYRFANPVHDYEKEFEKHVASMNLVNPTLSCNCVLNYFYAKLEGKKTANVLGPMTFGEIAYMLLNQTMVYITFEDRDAR